MEKRPLLRVVLVPSAPMKEERALDGRVGENYFGQILLFFGHGSEGSGLRSLRNTLDDAGVLLGEEALGYDDVKKYGEREGSQGNEQGDCLKAKHHFQRASVESDHAIEGVFGEAKQTPCCVLRRVSENAGGHHGSERERDNGGKDDGDRQGNRKFAKEAADDVTHLKSKGE